MMNTIISLIICFTELYICFDFFNSFFIKKSIFADVKRIMFFTGMVGIFHFVLNSFNRTYLNMIAFPIVFMFYVSVLFQGSFKKKLIYIIFICIIFFGCEFLFAILLNVPQYLSWKDSFMDLSSIPWQLFTLLLLKYLICNIFKQISKNSNSTMDSKIYISYLCIPVASLGIMMLTYYSEINLNTTEHTKVMLCIFFAIMQLGNIFIFYAFQKYSIELYNNIRQQYIITQQSSKLEHYIQMKHMDDRQKAFIHDTTHYLKTIGLLISENKNEEALHIINSLNIDLDLNVSSIYTDNHIMNAVLSDKKRLAEKNHVSIDIYVEPGADMKGISEQDIIIILSNLIDNAIEASSKCPEAGSIYVRIFTQNQGNFFVIKITNHFVGSLYKIGDIYKSTKKETGLHGIGLKSVKETAEKNGGFLECYVEDGKFVAVLLLPRNRISK